MSPLIRAFIVVLSFAGAAQAAVQTPAAGGVSTALPPLDDLLKTAIGDPPERDIMPGLVAAIESHYRTAQRSGDRTGLDAHLQRAKQAYELFDGCRKAIQASFTAEARRRACAAAHYDQMLHLGIGQQFVQTLKEEAGLVQAQNNVCSERDRFICLLNCPLTVIDCGCCKQQG